MKNVQKRVSIFLSLLLTLSLVPASVLSAAAADAYQILFEPQVSLADVQWYAYGDTALAERVGDDVYRLVRFNGSGMADIPGEFADYPLIGADYISVTDADGKVGVINKNGEKVVDYSYDYISRPGDDGTAKAIQGENYFLLDLKSGQSSAITEDQFEAEGSSYRLEQTEGGYAVINAHGIVILTDAGREYTIFDSTLSSIDKGLIRVRDRSSGMEGLIGLNGEAVLPIQYERVSNVSPDGLVWTSSDGGRKVSLLKVGGASAPVQPSAAEAMPTNDTLKVNGVVQNATVYKINDSNYFKIRDLAAVLNGTSKQFAVGYDAASSSVTAATGQPYEMAGGELAGAASGNQAAAVSNDTIIVNGVKAENVTVYKIDGSNYFKLRDLGDALGFEVGWSAEEGMFINTEG